MPPTAPISILSGMAAFRITEDALELLALDRLPESAAAPAEEHLLLRSECRERLAGWDEYVSAMRAALHSRRHAGLASQPK